MKRIFQHYRLYFISITVILFLFFSKSCVFKKNSDKVDTETISYNQKIAQTQNDAAILVEIAILNLTTLNLLNHINIIEFKGNQQKIKSFKKINHELKFDINRIATKKLISIPNQYDIIDNLSYNQNAVINYPFDQNDLENILKEQLDLFTQLQQNTLDRDILAFSIKSKEKLSAVDFNT